MITRIEAEERILKALETIWETYKDYNPNGERLTLMACNGFIHAENDFSLGGADYDFPICLSKVWKEENK